MSEFVYTRWRRQTIPIWLLLVTVVTIKLHYTSFPKRPSPAVEPLLAVNDSRYKESRGAGPEEETGISVEVPDCQCQKHVSLAQGIGRDKSSTETHVRLNQTTCSPGAHKLGSHQKVLAFTYYETDSYDGYHRDYFTGISENLRTMKDMYPADFRMRLYYEIPEGSKTIDRLCKLACEEPSLDLCNVLKNPKYGDASILYPLVWRFLAVVDPQVDIYFSRDLDSVISDREVEAVKEFLASQAAVHVMRDHPGHGIGMLGGTWGSNLTDPMVRKLWRKSFSKLIHDAKAYSPKNKAGPDQDILTRYVWRPWAERLSLSHDSFFCSKYPNAHSFPTKREDKVGNFIGAPVVTLKEKLNLTEAAICPVECRRQPDWTYC